MLRGLIERSPDDPVLLYNYGMMLSDEGTLDEARERLSHLVALEPDHANGGIALGVPLSRQGREGEALAALERAVAIDGENAYPRRNLGALLARTDPEKALAHLHRAAELLPGDQQAQYGYGLGLLQAGRVDEADAVLRRAMALNEYSEIAELCREHLARLAQATMRERGGGKARMDVVMYCLAAMETFKALSAEEVRKITIEIGLVGRAGLDINDPARRYRLRSMPGDFSGVQLAAYMFVGFRQIAPDTDPGIDFTEEYRMAAAMRDAQRG